MLAMSPQKMTVSRIDPGCFLLTTICRIVDASTGAGTISDRTFDDYNSKTNRSDKTKFPCKKLLTKKVRLTKSPPLCQKKTRHNQLSDTPTHKKPK